MLPLLYVVPCSCCTKCHCVFVALEDTLSYPTVLYICTISQKALKTFNKNRNLGHEDENQHRNYIYTMFAYQKD